MFRCQGNRLIDIRQGLLDRLAGQAVHEIQIQVVEPGATGHVDRGQGFGVVMDATERLEVYRVEALDADRQPVDAGAPVIGKLGLLEGAGVGLQGDFDIAGKAQPGSHGLQDLPQAVGGKQARRAATKEDRANFAPLNRRQILLQIRYQRRDIFLLGKTTVTDMGVEVTVGALAHAPGNMDVGRQRRELQVASFKRQAVRVAGWVCLRLGACGLRLGQLSPKRLRKSAIALALWLMRFLSAAGSSALAQSLSGTQNSGS